jgi:hypothetical protein
MLHGVNFNAKKFAHIIFTPISPSWNTFLTIHDHIKMLISGVHPPTCEITSELRQCRQWRLLMSAKHSCDPTCEHYKLTEHSKEPAVNHR